MVARRGAGSFGCLFPLLIAAVVVYFGRDFGEVYFRYYKFQDAMKQEVRFASIRNDDVITAHLRLLADSLDLPRRAAQVRITHTSTGPIIWSDYEETVSLPLDKEKTLHFHPSSEKSY